MQAVALVRRLPRPGAVLQRRVRRPELRRRQRPRRPRPASPARSATRSRTSTARAATPTTRSRSRCTIRSPSARTRRCAGSTDQLVKAKPEFHKKTFLKPLHKTAEFCGTCHKVHLPPELNHYKWLRGQNHYDTFLLSGVSGHGVQSFYYPPKAQANCNGCHMPLRRLGRLRRQALRRLRRAHGPRPPVPVGATPRIPHLRRACPTWVDRGAPASSTRA